MKIPNLLYRQLNHINTQVRNIINSPIAILQLTHKKNTRVLRRLETQESQILPKQQAEMDTVFHKTNLPAYLLHHLKLLIQPTQYQLRASDKHTLPFPLNLLKFLPFLSKYQIQIYRHQVYHTLQ